MSNEMVTTGGFQLSEAEFNDIFNPANMADDLSAGVSSGFGVISIRGSKWRIKKGGEETPVVDAAGDPVARLEVVILKASTAVSKTYYAGAYIEGSNEEPDCSSSDGIAPDAGCSNPQSKTCAMCPQNQWGSRVTEAGKKAKNCSDTRMVAVILADDLAGANFDGPLMLRVPPASLGDLSIYGKRMAQKNAPYNVIVTALGFDMNTAYPKLTFKAVRALNREEQMQYAQFYLDGSVENIIHSTTESSTANIKATPTVDTEFEQGPITAEAPAEPAPEAKAPAEPKLSPQQKAAITRKRNAELKAEEAKAELAAEPTPAPTPAPTASEAPAGDVVQDSLDASLDDMLKDLDVG